MVDIVIVNWNAGKYLLDCVNSINTEVNQPYFNRIIIIDNHSSDNSIAQLPYSPKISIIQNPQNVGFSKACNQGFKICNAPYTLLLNPDAQLLDNTLQKCVEFMQANPTIDILGCALNDENANRTASCARYPTPLHFFYDAIGLSKIAPSTFTPALLMTDWDHKNNRKVDQVMGAFMFMPTGIFKKYRYFDERFFVYYEELDFSKRVSDAGGTIFFNAEIEAIHSGGGTTNQVKGFRTFLNLRSRLQYSKKHFSTAGYAATWFTTCVIEPITRSFFLLIKGKLKEIPEVFKAYRMLTNGHQ